MRDIFPDASIETKIIDMQFNENRYIQSVVVQATITVPGNDGVPDAVAQGLSLAERSKGGQVGFLEKCETAAIGRALASLGFVADGTGYASADEMNQNTTSVEKMNNHNQHQSCLKLASWQSSRTTTRQKKLTLISKAKLKLMARNIFFLVGTH